VENLEDILDSHDPLLPLFVGGVAVFWPFPFKVAVFSVEAVLEKLGRLLGTDFCGVEVGFSFGVGGGVVPAGNLAGCKIL
jgi:hypothetical protein